MGKQDANMWKGRLGNPLRELPFCRGCLAALGRRYAYFEAGDTVKPRQLLSSLLSQLHEKSKRTREMGYASSVCDSIPDFLVQLQCGCLL
jgi:hypothetical protein